MGRVGSLVVSPDGKTGVYTVGYYSIKENKGHTVLYLIDLKTKQSKLLTQSDKTKQIQHFYRMEEKSLF